jgi:hypothetical protein
MYREEQSKEEKSKNSSTYKSEHINQKESRAEQSRSRSEWSKAGAEQNRADRAETLSTNGLKFDHQHPALHFPRSRTLGSWLRM